MYKKSAYSHMLHVYDIGVVHWYIHLDLQKVTQHVRNEVKGRISKRLLQENKARKCLVKLTFFYPIIRAREFLTCFVFL